MGLGQHAAVPCGQRATPPSARSARLAVRLPDGPFSSNSTPPRCVGSAVYPASRRRLEEETAMIKLVKIHEYEMGLYFHDGEFQGLLEADRYWFFDPLNRVRVDIVSQRAPWLTHDKLDVIVKSGLLAERALVLDLKDYERALVWIDGRFSHVLPPGLYAYWTTFCSVRAEVVDARTVRFEHPDLPVIVKSQLADRVLECVAV